VKTRFLGLIGCAALLGLPVLFLLSLSAPARASTYQYTFTGSGDYAGSYFTIEAPNLYTVTYGYPPGVRDAIGDIVIPGDGGCAPCQIYLIVFTASPPFSDNGVSWTVYYHNPNPLGDSDTFQGGLNYYLDSTGSYNMGYGELVISSQTPLPAALPLFGTGLFVTGLFGWRRKRKNTASIAAA